jgi:hypothetical protein
MRDDIGHATADARERNDISLATRLAIHAHNAVREDAAALVFIEFLDDELRIATNRCTARGGIGEQHRAILANDAMQRSRFGAPGASALRQTELVACGALATNLDASNADRNALWSLLVSTACP